MEPGIKNRLPKMPQDAFSVGVRYRAFGSPAAGYSAPGVLAEAADKTGRAKGDFEIARISREQFDQIKSLIF